jgi:(p)ppGpp synthase/HD superfamily hydrolase
VAQVYDILGVRVIVRAAHATPTQRPAHSANGDGGRDAATGTSKDLSARKRAACFLVEDAVAALWPPVAGRRKDYISCPKPNGYQSLHLTVELPEEFAARRAAADAEARSCGEPESPGAVEIQIRTDEMHAAAERGGAAHFGYKGGLDASQATRLHEWTRELMGVRALDACATVLANCTLPPALCSLLPL